MPQITFTSTKANAGRAPTPQSLIWRIYQKIGDIGVLVLPNGREIKGSQLRQCAFPDFRSANWSKLAGDADWSSFVELMADLAPALEAYSGTTNRQVFRIPSERASSLAPSGYAADVVFQIDVQPPAPYRGAPSPIAPRPAAPAVVTFSAAPAVVPVAPDPAEASREQAFEDAARKAAHTFRGAMGRFSTDHDAIVRVLNRSPIFVRRVCEIYTAEGSWTGKGMWADVVEYCSSRYVELIGALLTRAGVSLGQPRVIYVQNATYGHDQHWISAKPAGRTAVPGTRVVYSVEMGAEMYSEGSGYTFQWFCLNDPDTSTRANADAVVFGTSTGTCEGTGAFPGNHKMLCRVQFREKQPGLFGGYVDHTPEYIEYQQTVSAIGDVLTAAMAKATDPQDPADQLRLVRGYREILLSAEQQPGSRKLSTKVKEGLDRQVEKLEDKLRSSEGKKRFPIRAVHLAAETATVSTLNAFVAKVSTDGDRETWTLVDITNPVDRRLTSEHTGTGRDAKEAILDAIRAWESGNRYPKGQLRVKIPAETGAEIEREFHTDGATFWDSIADFFNTVGFWAGIAALGAAVILSIAPEPTLSKAAAVALWTSILAGTTGAVIGIVQRHAEHMATFSEDAFDVVTIVGNILGARWALGATIKGLSLAGTRTGTAVVIGLITTDAAQGILLSAEYLDEYQQILSDPDPKSRVDRLLALIRAAVLSGALLVLSLKGNAAELSKLKGLKGKQVDLGKLGDKQQTIDVSQNEVEAQAKAKADAEAKARAEAEAKAKAEAEAKAREEAEARARIEEEVKAKGHPGEAPEGWRRAVARIQDAAIGKLAATLGVTIAEYKALANDYLRDLFRGAAIYKRVKVWQVEAILADGRFKSLFETGTSGGTTNTRVRGDTERYVFGFDETKTPVEKRPQYGYLSTDPDGAHPGPRQYGDTTIRLKPEVRDRATFTFGDSLDSTRGGSYPALSPKPVNEPELGAFDFGAPYGPPDPLDLGSVDQFMPYVEVQVHGGLDVHAIAEVIFDAAPPRQVAERLNQLHIPWRVK